MSRSAAGRWPLAATQPNMPLQQLLPSRFIAVVLGSVQQLVCPLLAGLAVLPPQISRRALWALSLRATASTRKRKWPRLLLLDRTRTCLEGPSLTGSISTTKNFVRIGHSLFAPLAGWLGGQLSQRLCRCSRSQEPSTTVDVEGITDIDDLTTTVRDMDDKRR